MHEGDAVDLDHCVVLAQPAPILPLGLKRPVHFHEPEGCAVEELRPKRGFVEPDSFGPGPLPASRQGLGVVVVEEIFGIQ